MSFPHWTKPDIFCNNAVETMFSFSLWPQFFVYYLHPQARRKGIGKDNPDAREEKFLRIFSFM